MKSFFPFFPKGSVKSSLQKHKDIQIYIKFDIIILRIVAKKTQKLSQQSMKVYGPTSTHEAAALEHRLDVLV